MVFYCSIMALVFVYGIAVGAYKIFPYKFLKSVLNDVEMVLADRERLLSNKPEGFIAQRRYNGSGVTVYHKGAVEPGYTLLSGFFRELPGVRLVQADGATVNEWLISYLSLFPNSDHIFPKSDVPATDWNAAVHGMYLYPDGSLVFNLDGKGTVKLDRCGQPEWVLQRMTHHSIHRSEDGTFWIPSRHYVALEEGEVRVDGLAVGDARDQAESVSFQHPLVTLPFRDDTILHVSEEGNVISEISVTDIFIKNGLYAALVGNGNFDVTLDSRDPLHINDIEMLSTEHAEQFPHFASGDLLLSMRHLNMLVVLDPESQRVKWYQVGPWLRQHDPDFHADGTITVFNNNSDDTHSGEILGGSQLLSLTPHAPLKSIKTLFGREQDSHFFTNTQGKHQVLSNGNVLIVEYYGGRAFEFDRSGRIVWQYVNGYDDEYVAKLSGATRYSEAYFTVKEWSCP